MILIYTREGIMRGKKIWCLVCLLVLGMLVSAGCKRKPDEPMDVIPEVEETQKDYVEKALKEIEKQMTAVGDIARQKKVKRSLAEHILKDHAAMMAHFQSQAWDEMVKDMGDLERIKVYKEVDANGDPIWWPGDMGTFWSELYDDKAKAFPDAASIELEIYADAVTLEDIDPEKNDQKDCKSLEVFKFRIIALDENGNEISNQPGGGERDRKHSGACPWG
jgi:hypothetical protein